MKRLITGVVLATLVVVTTRWLPLPVFWGGLVLLALLAAWELSTLLVHLGLPPWRLLVMAAVVGLIGCFALEVAVLPVVTLLLFVALLAPLFGRGSPELEARRVVATVFAALYIGLTMGHVGGLVDLTFVGGQGRGDLLLLALVAVYLGDTSAYYGGRTFGRHPMAPRLSPKKTWEGAAFNVVGSIAGALLAPLWFAQGLSWGHAVAIGALLAVAGMAGDLVESLIKRGAAIKDSGSILPGHGGMLDRVDSLLLAAPALYWYFRLWLAD